MRERIAPDERRWVLGFAVLVMLATTIPYVAGYALQGASWRFTGFVFGVEDGNSYIAKMLSGAAGAWLFRTPYTSQPQNGVLAFLPYLLLGKLAAPPGIHEQLVALFHLFRFVAGILEILATYQFLALFLDNRKARRLGVALCVLGGGLGWVFLLAGKGDFLGSIPLEFYSPETFGFLALYGLPHLALARALLLWGLRVYLQPEIAPVGLREPLGKLKWVDPAGIAAGGLLLALGLAQPLTVVIAWAVLAVHLGALGISILLNRSGWGRWAAYVRRALWTGAISSPLVIYTVLAFGFDPYLRQWAAQNRILSPPPLHYLVAYGLLLPFAVFGGRGLLRRKPEWGWLPVAWAVMLPVLAYLPYNLQRRLPEGGWVALVILGVAAYDVWLSHSPVERRAPGMIFYPLGLAFPAALVLVGGGLLAVLHPGLPLYRPVEEVKAYESLALDAKPGEVVMSAYETGNALPAWAPLRVVIGHGPESANLEAWRSEVTAFYERSTSDSERLRLLDATGARYVFWGPAERRLGDWDPHNAQYLQLKEQSGDYAVFVWQPAGQ